MIVRKFYHYLQRLQYLQRVNVALSKAAAVFPSRQIDPRTPMSWECSAFSQNGEDGILDYLTSQLVTANRHFVEIGASDGLENNTAWLAIAKKYTGLMIEADDAKVRRASQILSGFNLGVKCVQKFVTVENAKAMLQQFLYSDPDVFSLDIDGNDYYIARALMCAGFRPKIAVVEYNSVFGPLKRLTIPYQENFSYTRAHESQLYYGVSIALWRRFFEGFQYQFVTVDRNGVNAFFIDPKQFRPEFASNVCGVEFKENFFQLGRFNAGWMEQFSQISKMGFQEPMG